MNDAPLETKILDFGIAKLQSAGRFASTAIGFGTACYMAPVQQMDAGHVDGRADLYSVCVILYEILTGRLSPSGRRVTGGGSGLGRGSSRLGLEASKELGR